MILRYIWPKRRGVEHYYVIFERFHTCSVDPLNSKSYFGIFLKMLFYEVKLKKTELSSKMSPNWSFNLITPTNLNYRKIPKYRF